MPASKTPREAYADFVRERIVLDRTSFHPDTPFSEYVRMVDGQPSYTPEAAATLQAEHDRLLGDFDPYAVCIEVDDRDRLIYLANKYASERKAAGFAPVLAHECTGAELLAWLRWYDPHTGFGEVERTDAELWGFIAEAVGP